MKRIIAIILSILSMFTFSACSNENAVLDEIKTYEITGEIRSLDIEINAADFTIEQGDKFLVESNLKYLTVSNEGGVLKIEDTLKNAVHYNGAILRVFVPSGALFDEVDIETGAAKLTAKTLTAKSLELELGAGNLQIDDLVVYNDAKIEGGAGKLTVKNGTINNLTMHLGVGALSMTAKLLGDNEIEFGVGNSNLTLAGGEEDYKVDIEKGIGSITMGGIALSSSCSKGSGETAVSIKGGVGAVTVSFQN